MRTQGHSSTRLFTRLAIAVMLSTGLLVAGTTVSASAVTLTNTAPSGLLACNPNSAAISATCLSGALSDYTRARAKEGLGPMSLPSNFTSMSVPNQLLVLTNIERGDRGLPTFLGLSSNLASLVLTAANSALDPLFPSWALQGGSNWASAQNSLWANYLWMYDDGLGSNNLDCTTSNQSGCWGHRTNILANYAAPLVMGAAAGSTGVATLMMGMDTHDAASAVPAPIAQNFVANGAVGVGAALGAQQIYTINAAGHLITMWQTSAGGTWSSWQDWGAGYTPGTPIGVGNGANGAQQIYVVNAAGHLMTMWQNTAGGTWSSWRDWGAGYPANTPIGVGNGANGAQQIYLVNAAGHLMTMWQTSPNGNWSNWLDWGAGYPQNTPVGVDRGADGSQQIYLVNSAQHLVTMWQTSPNGTWSNWLDWGAGYPTRGWVGTGGSGGLQQIYTVNAAGHLLTSWQLVRGGTWSSWLDWGNGYTVGAPIGVGSSQDAQQIYLINGAGHLMTMWQYSAGSTWTSWQDWGN